MTVFDQLPFIEQLGNVGAEIGRCVRWRQRDAAVAERARERALVLLERIAGDARWGEEERRAVTQARGVVASGDAAGMERLDGEITARVLAHRTG